MWRVLYVSACAAFAWIGLTCVGDGDVLSPRAALAQGAPVLDVAPEYEALSSHPQLRLDTRIESPPQNNNVVTLPEKQRGDAIRFQLFAPYTAGRQIQGYTVELALRGKTISSYVGDVSGTDLNGGALTSRTSSSGNPTLSMLSLSALTVPSSGYLGQATLRVSRELTSSDVLEVASAETAGAGGVQSLDVSQAVLTFTAAAACLGDFDGDGKVNLSDFLAFAGAFGTRSGDANYNAGADMDGSGAVDLLDFLAFSRVFGAPCPTSPPPPPGGADREALVALYNATDGPNWRFNTNWLSDRPLGEWYGVTTDAGGRVTELRLYAFATSSGDTVGAGSGADGQTVGNGLSGVIPAELGDLSNLTGLDLGYNQLSGPIPPELGSLSSLTDLILANTQLSGSIPVELGNISNLQTLDLAGNQFSGALPSSLVNLTNLRYLNLAHNQFSGALPSWLVNLTNLQMLILDDNQLTGALPSWLGNLSNLQTLGLAYNQFSGALPSSLANLTNMQYLWLQGTQLCAPTDAAFQTWLQGVENKLGVVNCGDGGSIAGDRAALVALYNATNGPEWTNRTNWLSDRPLGEWYGVTTDAGGRVTGVDLASNQLSGTIPAELGNLTNLQTLHLVGNELSGGIPTWLGSLTNLQWLDLGHNALGGAIPVELSNLTNLQTLHLYNMQLSGTIPTWLGSLTNLRGLSLAHNALEGTVPVELSNLTNLQILQLADMQLSGTIPTWLGSLTNLRWLTLNTNQLAGTIPGELGNLNNLELLTLNNNPGLSGSLPSSFTNLASLRQLYLEGTGLCAPTDAAFQKWLQGIANKSGVVNCADGGGSGTPTRLTRSDADDRYPAWSPDGARIAFASERNGNFEVYVMDADGSNLTRLTDNSAEDTYPAWSPNGAKIAFRSRRDDSSGEIYVMDADGSNVTRLTHNTGQLPYDKSPTWSPDGARIAFASNRDGGFEIYVMEADGENVTRLTHSSTSGISITNDNPVWSPNGTKIAFHSNRDGNNNYEIYVMDADGSNPTRLTDSSTEETNPVWSPDGAKIAFNSNRDGSGNYGIFMMDADGSNVTRLTYNSAFDPWPSWSPDGAKIVFTSRRDGNYEIYVIDVNGVNGGSIDRAALVTLYNATNGPGWENRTNWLSDRPLAEWYGVTTDADGRVRDLRLEGNNLTGTIPAQLGRLTNLTLLWLGRNQLSGLIPSSLGNLTNLVWLNLNNNQLSGPIPSSLGNLSRLTRLYLAGNSLTGCLPTQWRNTLRNDGSHDDIGQLDMPFCNP